MRREDIAADRQAFLAPAPGYPHVLALVAPPTPRALPHSRSHDVIVADAHAALGRLQGAIAHIPNADMVTRTLARREAVSSSQIEGTQSDLAQLLAYEATQAAGNLPADVRITARYVVALQHGLDRVRARGRAAIDLMLVDELHAQLMGDEPASAHAGRYRQTQVWIGSGRRIEDARFVPAPPAEIARCMREMESGILQYAPRQDEQTSLSLVAQLAIAHVQFETIHPYLDGNGRVGRLLLPLLLAAEGHPPLYLSGALLRARREYYEALSAVQLRGDWSPWLALLGNAVIESCDESIAIARDLLALAERWESQLSTRRAKSAARRLPRFLIGHPVLSVSQAAAGLGLSIQATNMACNGLLDAGILRLLDERKRNRIFIAAEVLERLDRAPS